MDLKERLYSIDNNLSQEDFESLKFLCSDIISNKRMDKMKSCLDLFDELQKSEELSEDNYCILQELLYLIGQHSLLRKLGTNKHDMEHRLQTEQKVSMYRRMLFELSESITMDDQRAIIFLLKIPSRFTENKSFLAILSYLDKTETISPDNVEVLENTIASVSQDLLKKINMYKKYRELQYNVVPSAPTDNSLSSLSAPPISIQDVSSSERDFKNDELDSIREHIEEVHELPSEKDIESENDISALSLQDQTQSEEYSMNRDHRGYCVIINNYKFTKLDARPGTEKDAENLSKVFTWLGFKVEIYNEQASEQILDIMKVFQMKDHTDQDCFVCCILTHGLSQVIFGTDNEVVNIKDIISNFTSNNCKTLAGKPKLFFIQACQGKDVHKSYTIEEDALTRPTIPNFADVLIGMSTVDGYKSYRHVQKGTWYIQALCSNLIKMVPKGEDILSILTRVNKEVSEKEYLNSGSILKQMPQPSYTLRKKLVFPIPSSSIAL